MLDNYTQAILWLIRECKAASIEAFFNRQKEIGKASPEKIAEMARGIIASGPKGHLILGADCSVPSPLDHTDNIHAAESAAHGR